MGNLTFIVPTEKINEFDIDGIESLLTKELKEYPQDLIVTSDPEFNQINVTLDGKTVIHLYLRQNCYILNYDEDIESLKEMNMHSLADKLEALKNFDPDLDNVIQATHSNMFEENNTILMILSNHFRAYIFDEGIHPEYIPPQYQFKNVLKKGKSKSLIDRFRDFTKK